MHGYMNVRNSPEDGISLPKHVGDDICHKWFIAECIDCKNMGGTSNIKEQNLTLNSGLSLNEELLQGDTYKDKLTFPLGRLIVLLRKPDQTKECRPTNPYVHLTF
jgi:hypothetical protein